MALPAGFSKKLQHCLPAGQVLLNPEDCKPFEADGLLMFRCLPAAVALPSNEAEVIRVVNCCREAGVPLVTRGAGTGLSGGALPHADGVLLVLSRLNRILSIDPLARVARVQPGVRNLAVSEATYPFGLFYAPDPSSQLACSIGGNVSENSGGVRCLKYGLTVHCVIKVRVVTADGEAVEIDNTEQGFDLLALLHGSEGLLAVVTEVWLRLSPLPETTCTVLAGFPSVKAAGDAVAGIISSGITPSGLEMMDQLATRAAEDFAAAGYPTDCAALLIAETDGRREDAERDMENLRKVLTTHGATPIRAARDETERQLFWKGRKSAFPAMGSIRPNYYCMDGTIPRKRLGDVLNNIAALSTQYGLPCANVFHAGDGNLHPLIMYDDDVSGEAEKACQFGTDIMNLCLDVGGTITGEHGVGVEKIDGMCTQFTPPELQTFHDIKHAFDPLAFLNPGKTVPTLNRCAEFGHMHVKSGEQKYN
jgi:glycolate oxidase